MGANSISNAKRLLLDINHDIGAQYLLNYLNEIYFKLNILNFGNKLYDRLLIAGISYKMILSTRIILVNYNRRKKD